MVYCLIKKIVTTNWQSLAVLSASEVMQDAIILNCESLNKKKNKLLSNNSYSHRGNSDCLLHHQAAFKIVVRPSCPQQRIIMSTKNSLFGSRVFNVLKYVSGLVKESSGHPYHM